METVVGVFRSPADAVRAASDLREKGFPESNLLLPGASDKQINAVPTSTTEQPGMAKAIGGVVGAALGIAGGLELGTLVASGIMIGVGPVVAVGMAAAAVLGAAGSVIGASTGAKVEENVDGLPQDEVYVYKDALRKGRSVLFVQAADESAAGRARDLLKSAGAESIDAAREEWWVGLRSAQKERYLGSGGNFEVDESAYRAGFEAALRLRVPTPIDLAVTKYCPPGVDKEAFRRGYERGQAHRAEDFAVDEASRESFPASDPPSY